MAEPSRAVFLSYASQDAEAAARICTTLRAAGIEVWFDQSELRGGDVWDRSIRQQIRECELFIAVISAHTDARREGYFRREWKLAVERTHDMSERVAFLVPVVIDDTSETRADVPDRFREVQWSRLPKGQTSPAFVARVQHLLSRNLLPTRREPRSAGLGALRRHAPSSWRPKQWVPAMATLLALALGCVAIDRYWIAKRSAATSIAARVAPVFAPPPHSIAVLPFVNMSGDKDQEYFSEGLTEELLNSLARINELQVAARTSSFSFQSEHPDIVTVAHKLNVASILEGSVRRSGQTIRVTAQLNNAVTGFHLWSQTYDRDLGDVLKLQTEIATAVANSLRITLLGNVAAKIEAGGTQNPEAFDAYLRASKAYADSQTETTRKEALSLYDEALRHDPNYALAFSGRSIVLETIAEEEFGKPPYRDFLSRAEADARRAIDLAPSVGEGHLALAYVFDTGLNLTRAAEEYERAVSLAPGNSRILRNYGKFIVSMGHTDAGIAAVRRAVIIDPLNPACSEDLIGTTVQGRLYKESLQAIQNTALLEPVDRRARLHAWEGIVYYLLGDLEKARASCELKTGPENSWQGCLALVYEKLGRHADASAMLAQVQEASGDSKGLEYAQIYAQWGETSKALEWLEKAKQLGDPELRNLRVDPLLDPLRNEPRFQAIKQAVERALKFPY